MTRARAKRMAGITAALAFACGSDPADDNSDDGAGSTATADAGSASTSGSLSDDGTPEPASSGEPNPTTSVEDSSGGGETSGGPVGGASFAELCAAPGVIFCDDFESGWDASWIEDGGDVRLVPDAAIAGEGSQAIELATYEGQQSSKLLRQFDDVDEIYVRFDVRYDQTYDNSGGSHGPILGGSMSPPWGLLGTAGILPDGSNHFVLNFEPLGPPVGQGAEFAFYGYYANMQPDGNGDYWGNVFYSPLRPAPVIVPGQWHCAEYGLTLNTPGETTDGLADFWIDGVHHGAFDGFQWRSAEGLRLNTFVLDSYNHFNNGPVPAGAPNLVRYDNVVLSTSPVGCLGS